MTIFLPGYVLELVGMDDSLSNASSNSGGKPLGQLTFRQLKILTSVLLKHHKKVVILLLLAQTCIVVMQEVRNPTLCHKNWKFKQTKLFGVSCIAKEAVLYVHNNPIITSIRVKYEHGKSRYMLL